MSNLFIRFLIGLLISLTVLVSIEIFFSFTAELKYLNVGNYGIVPIVKYTILSIPKSILIMFPYAVLIGSMLSLGAMASDMEFISMHAAGISITKVIMIIMVQAFLVSTIFYAASDNFVPKILQKKDRILKKTNSLSNKEDLF